MNYPESTLYASLAQQCKAPNGEIGSFLFAQKSHTDGRLLISPVFKDTAKLFQWCADNDWYPVPGTYANRWAFGAIGG